MDGHYFTVDMPAGQVVVEHGQDGRVTAVWFDRRKKRARRHSNHPLAKDLRRYLAGEEVRFDQDLDLTQAPPFFLRVWQAVRRIPRGQVRTYGEVAAAAGNPAASRAVGQAMARNRFPILIPCHRVLSASGLGGFSSGTDLKRWLLELEGVDV